MLVVTRRINESVMIGEDVEITVLQSRGNQVRIGIAAPREVPVHRREIWDRIQAGKDVEESPAEAPEEAL
jgi:carbon storage regulator